MLTLQNVSVIYPDKTTAINNLSLSLNEGQTIALIGENGAGKTSLLLAIVGILPAAQGSISFKDIPLSKKTLGEFRKQIALVFQNPDDQLFMPFIFDDIAFGCRNYGMAEDEITKRVDETLARLHITHLRNRSSLKLSSGEKRMAAIATVLAMDPSILMLDEPTAFLDPKAKRNLAATLKQLPHAQIIATHDIEFAMEVCNRVIVLKEGCLMADGDTSLLHDKECMLNYGL